jgi:hypothetical protein
MYRRTQSAGVRTFKPKVPLSPVADFSSACNATHIRGLAAETQGLEPTIPCQREAGEGGIEESLADDTSAAAVDEVPPNDDRTRVEASEVVDGEDEIVKRGHLCRWMERD